MTARAMTVLAAAALAACSGKLPETRYYQLAAPAGAARGGDGVLVLDSLATDPAYDDDRIVYRTTPYRLDYYQYHRWASAPGAMIGNYLEQALEHSGRFHAVLREVAPDTPVLLGGRVLAIEEVDRSSTAWFGHIAVELALTDARTGELLWSEEFDEIEPLAQQSPEGLAAALSRVMARIAQRIAPPVAELAMRQTRAHAERAAAAAPRSP